MKVEKGLNMTGYKMMISRLIWPAILFVWVGCSVPARDVIELPTIHPKVFQMVFSWLSDTASPVVTEVNLDAVGIDRNQFDFDAVTNEDGWVTFRGREPEEYLRYRVLGRNGNTYEAQFQDNGGGTYTSDTRIVFTLTRRAIVSDGERKEALVLRVDSVRWSDDEVRSLEQACRLVQERPEIKKLIEHYAQYVDKKVFLIFEDGGYTDEGIDVVLPDAWKVVIEEDNPERRIILMMVYVSQKDGTI